MLSMLINKYNWAFIKPLLIETYLYLLVGAVVFAVLLYIAKKALKVKIKWSMAFIMLLLLTQYFWYKHSSTLAILTGKLPMSTQIGVIDQATHTIKGDSRNGFLAYGPYMPLAKGAYKVTFKIQLEKLNNQGIGFCDVNVLEHPESYVRTELVLDGFKKQNPQDVSIIFPIPEGNPKVEFRVFQYGGNTLTLADLHLAPAGVREIILKNKDYIFKGTIYIFGALLFIAIYLKFLSRVKKTSVRKVLEMTSFIAVFSGLIMALIWHWKGFSHYTFVNYYDMWRVFYAPAWLPLMFIFFNFLYLINGRLEFNKEIEKYLKYDRYTLLVIPAFIITELLVKTINTHMLPGNFYLGTLAAKSVIYFIFLWQNIKVQQDIQSNKTVKWTIFLSIFTVYMLITPWVNAAFYTDGDETIYLLKTQTIIKDNDLDILNNTKNGDVLSYHSDVSWLPWAGTLTSSGTAFTLVPGFLAAGRFGAVLTMNIMGALLAFNIFSLTILITGSISSAFCSMLIGAFSGPLGIYSFLIYPEIVASLIVIYSIRKILSLRQNNVISIVNITFLAGLLIILKERYIILSAMILLALMYKIRRNYKIISIFIITLVAAVVTYVIYDKISINNSMGMGKIVSAYNYYIQAYKQLGKGINGILGLVFDQECGLLIYTPIYFLSLLGLATALSRKELRPGALLMSGIFLPYFLTVAFNEIWWGGGAPAPRYIVAVIPILAIALGVFISYSNKLWLRLFSLLAWLWSLGIYYVLVLIPQIRVHSPNHITGRNEILDRLYALNILPNLTVLFPSFHKPTDTTYFLTILFIIIFAILALFYVKQEKQPLEVFNLKKAVKLTIVAVMAAGFVLGLAKSAYYNWQEFKAVNCYSGGGTRLPEGILLNGGNFFVLTKVALRKEEKTIIRVKAKAVFNDGWPILNVATGTDNLHEKIGQIEINSSNWQEYQIKYTPNQGGLLPFWFEYVAFATGRDIIISEIIFTAEKKSKWMGFLNYQIGRLDEILSLNKEAKRRFNIAANLGYQDSF